MGFNVGITLTAKNATNRPLKEANKNLEKLGRTARKTSKSLGVLRLAFGFLAVSGVIRLGKAIVDTVGKMQLMLIRLANVEGGAKKAQVTFDKLFKAFGASPFTIDAVTNSFIRLRAAGIESNLAFDAVQAAADAIAAFGGTSEELKRFSIGLQQVAGKGVLSMEELRQQIGEALPVAMRVFASQTGRSISEVIDDVEKGRISSQEFIEELTTGLQKSFGGFALKLGDTLLGSIQGLKTKIQKAFAGDLFTNDVAVRLTAIIQNIGDAVQKFLEELNGDDVDQFFTALNNGITIVVNFGKVMFQVAGFIVKAFNVIVNAFSPENIGTVGAFGLLGLAVLGPPGAILGVIAGIAAVGTAADVVLEKMKRPINPEDTFWGRLLNFSIFEDGGVDEQFAKAKAKFADFKLTESGGGGAFDDFIGTGTSDTRFGGTAEQLAKITKNLDEVRNPTKKLDALIQGLGRTSQQARKQLEGLAKSTAAALSGAETFAFVKKAETALNRLDKIIEGFEGDRKLQKKLAALTERTPTQEDQLEALNRELVKMDVLIAKVVETIKKTKGIGFAKELAKANDKAGGVLAKFKELIGGTSELQQTINKITEEYRDQEAELTKQLIIVKALGSLDSTAVTRAAELQAALDIINDKKREANALAREQAGLDGQILSANTKIVQLQTSQEITNLKRSTRGAVATLTASDLGDAATDRRQQLNISMEETKRRIFQIQQQINDAASDPALQKSLEAQQIAAGELLIAQQDALRATSAAGMAAQQMWASVRDTMVQAAEEGLKGLITGTKTFKEVTRDAFDQITNAAIKYLIELIRIKIQTIALNALQNSGGGGGNIWVQGAAMLAQAFASKSGNAVTKFGKGGIAGQIGNVVRGPTMFGIAGEAGEEGILPLANVGGKLGVNAGGTGGEVSVHINAIDTQSGMEFLFKNKSQLVNLLRNESSLNNAVGKSR